MTDGVGASLSISGERSGTDTALTVKFDGERVGESVADGNRRVVKEGDIDGERGGIWGLVVAVSSSNDDARNGIDEGSIGRELGTSRRDEVLCSDELTGFSTVWEESREQRSERTS